MTDLPTLDSGSHPDPSTGACLMELVSVLAGERWTDDPECVNPVLRIFGRRVNDLVASEEYRTRELAPLIPRLIGTRPSDPRTEAEMTIEMAEWAIQAGGNVTLDVPLNAAREKYEEGYYSRAEMRAGFVVEDVAPERIEVLRTFLDIADRHLEREPSYLTEDQARYLSEWMNRRREEAA